MGVLKVLKTVYKNYHLKNQNGLVKVPETASLLFKFFFLNMVRARLPGLKRNGPEAPVG